MTIEEMLDHEVIMGWARMTLGQTALEGLANAGSAETPERLAALSQALNVLRKQLSPACAVVRCEAVGCGAAFVQTDPRQRFCPPAAEGRESPCATRGADRPAGKFGAVWAQPEEAFSE